jgi:glutathione synthase
LHGESLKIDSKGRLFVQGNEVAVIYYRNGYSPDQFESEEDWQVRENLELNRAIKNSSVDTILVNFKKIQCALQSKAVLK